MKVFVTRIKNFVLLFFPLFVSSCGQAAHHFVEPKATPTPLARTPNLSALAIDTTVNILRNSLLEAILLLIAVILFMRYKASSDKNRQLKEKLNNKHVDTFIDYKSSFDYSNWHFNEEERK